MEWGAVGLGMVCWMFFEEKGEEEEEEEEDVGSRRGAGVVNVRIIQGGGVEWRVKFGKLDCCVLISMGVQLMCLG